MKNWIKILFARLKGPGIVSFNEWMGNSEAIGEILKESDKTPVNSNGRFNLKKLKDKLSGSLNLVKALPIPDFNNQYDPTIL